MSLKYLYLFIARRIYLFFYILKKHFFRMFLSSLGLLISLVLIFSILGILRPLKKFIVNQFEKNIPAGTIEVKGNIEQGKTPGLVSLFRKKNDFSMGISEAFVAETRNWNEIENIHLTQILQKSILAKFDHPVLSKMGISFDLLVHGIDYGLVASNLKCMQNFQPSYETGPSGETISLIPLVLPESFAEMAYAYTAINGLPAINKANIIGLRLNLNVGQSMMNNARDEETGEMYVGVVCGFVSHSMVSFAGAPLGWVKKLHLRDRQYKAASSYDKMYIRIKNIKDENTIIDRLTSYGLTVVSEKENTYNKISKWLNRIDILLWAFVSILLLISAISLSNSFMILTTQKRYEFGLYLVFGASPLFLWVLIFVEGAFWGAFHSSLAYFIANNFSHFLQQSLQVLPWASRMFQGNLNFDFTISFAEKWYLIMGSILFSGVSSLIPTVIMTGRKTLSMIKKD